MFVNCTVWRRENKETRLELFSGDPWAERALAVNRRAAISGVRSKHSPGAPVVVVDAAAGTVVKRDQRQVQG